MLAAFLANEFPQAVFRSGNADGPDALFARGVNAIAPERLTQVSQRIILKQLNRTFFFGF